MKSRTPSARWTTRRRRRTRRTTPRWRRRWTSVSHCRGSQWRPCGRPFWSPCAWCWWIGRRRDWRRIEFRNNVYDLIYWAQVFVWIAFYRFLAPLDPLAFFSDLVLIVLTGSSLGARADTYLLHSWTNSSVVKLVASSLTCLSLEDSVWKEKRNYIIINIWGCFIGGWGVWGKLTLHGGRKGEDNGGRWSVTHDIGFQHTIWVGVSHTGCRQVEKEITGNGMNGAFVITLFH